MQFSVDHLDFNSVAATNDLTKLVNYMCIDMLGVVVIPYNALVGDGNLAPLLKSLPKIGRTVCMGGMPKITRAILFLLLSTEHLVLERPDVLKLCGKWARALNELFIEHQNSRIARLTAGHQINVQSIRNASIETQMRQEQNAKIKTAFYGENKILIKAERGAGSSSSSSMSSSSSSSLSSSSSSLTSSTSSSSSSSSSSDPASTSSLPLSGPPPPPNDSLAATTVAAVAAENAAQLNYERQFRARVGQQSVGTPGTRIDVSNESETRKQVLRFRQGGKEWAYVVFLAENWFMPLMNQYAQEVVGQHGAILESYRPLEPGDGGEQAPHLNIVGAAMDRYIRDGYRAEGMSPATGAGAGPSAEKEEEHGAFYDFIMLQELKTTIKPFLTWLKEGTKRQLIAKKGIAKKADAVNLIKQGLQAFDNTAADDEMLIALFKRCCLTKEKGGEQGTAAIPVKSPQAAKTGGTKKDMTYKKMFSEAPKADQIMALFRNVVLPSH